MQDAKDKESSKVFPEMAWMKVARGLRVLLGNRINIWDRSDANFRRTMRFWPMETLTFW